MNLAIYSVTDDQKDLENMTESQLRGELLKCFGLTVYGLRTAATIVSIMEKRGIDLSDMKLALLPYLRKIASNQVMPEVIIRFVGVPSLLNVIGNLPMPDQEKLAAGEPVPLMVVGPEGRAIRMADPLLMSMTQRTQAFARDRIRDEAEQALFLDSKLLKASTPIPERIGKLKIDKERGGVMVGRQFIPLDDLARAVSVLRK